MSYQRPAPTVLDADMWYEDFEVGRTFISPTRTLSEEEIIAFGKSYADLPYHTDPVAAAETAFGGLVAAGYQTVALTFGLYVETGVLRACGMGSPGADKLRWHKPVFAGDTLHVEATVLEISPAKQDGGRDAIRMQYETFNQNGEKVLTLVSLHFVRRRPAEV